MATELAATSPATTPKLGFLSRFFNAFESLFKHAPGWEHTASTVISFTAPFVVAALDLYAPAAALVAVPIINKIKADLAALSVMTGDGSSPMTVSVTLENIVANLPQLLDAAEFKDQASKDKATQTVNLIVGEFQAVHAMLPKAA